MFILSPYYILMQDGNTAIMEACLINNVPIMIALVGKGANLDVKNNVVRTHPAETDEGRSRGGGGTTPKG